MALIKNAGGLTLPVFDGGQLLVHGLVCGLGEGFSCGTIAVMHQVRGHHPDETRRNSRNMVSYSIHQHLEVGPVRSTLLSHYNQSMQQM